MNPIDDTSLAQPLLNKLQWRYAAKKMNPTKAVPQEKVERILEAARLAPTSSGLQPFEIIVVTDPAVRARSPTARTCWYLLHGTTTRPTAST